VYDVSASFLWKDGNQQVLHSAGVDLTVALEQAPHGVGALERFPVVGIVQTLACPRCHPDNSNIVLVEINISRMI
jgi:predicted heme/steroid binding protein